jgi:hypothetical protein
MALLSVNKSIAALVMESKLNVVDDLVSFFESKIEIDDDLKAMFDEFKKNLKDSEEKVIKTVGKKNKSGKELLSDESGEKKKRAPSVFNLYVKDIMPDIKAKYPDVKDGKKMIGFAAESWKTDPMAAFIKEKVIEFKVDDKDANIVELYAKAKNLYKNTDESNVKVSKKSTGKK